MALERSQRLRSLTLCKNGHKQKEFLQHSGPMGHSEKDLGQVGNPVRTPRKQVSRQVKMAELHLEMSTRKMASRFLLVCVKDLEAGVHREPGEEKGLK